MHDASGRMHVEICYVQYTLSPGWSYTHTSTPNVQQSDTSSQAFLSPDFLYIMVVSVKMLTFWG